MKLTIFALISIAVVLQTIYADSNPEDEVIAESNVNPIPDEVPHNEGNEGSHGVHFNHDESNPFLGLIHRYQDLGREIFDGFRRSAELGLNAGVRFAEAIGKSVDVFFREASQFSDAVAVTAQDIVDQSVVQFIAIIDTLQRTIAAILSDIEANYQRDILQKVQTHLGRTAKSVQNIQQVVENVRDKLRFDVEESASDIVDSWNDWANGQLEVAFSALNGNYKSYRHVQELVNDFINTYSGYLNNCSDEIVADLQKFETNVQDAIERYRKVVEKLVREVQVCLRSSNLRCQRNIENELRNLGNAPREFFALGRNGKNLLNTDFLSRNCVKRTLGEFSGEQWEITAKIDSLADNEEITTTTEVYT